MSKITEVTSGREKIERGHGISRKRRLTAVQDAIIKHEMAEKLVEQEQKDRPLYFEELKKNTEE